MLTVLVFVVALEEYAPIPDRFAMGMVKQQVAYVILVHVTSRTQFVIQQMVLVRYMVLSFSSTWSSNSYMDVTRTRDISMPMPF